jgi:hypothetical protein
MARQLHSRIYVLSKPVTGDAMTDTTHTDITQVNSLTGMITKAAAALAQATTSAEILDVIQHTTVAYDAAKTMARLAKARDAHAEIVAACHKAQADALEIEAQAQCRLADEYDAAQEHGEVQTAGGDRTSIITNENNALPTVGQIGLTSKLVHESRQVRNAERDNPGVVRLMLDERLSKGEAPTRADVKRSIEPKHAVAEPSKVDPPQQHEPESQDDNHDYDAWFDANAYCDFCGEHHSKRDRTIEAGELLDEGDETDRTAFICDECLNRCIKLLDRDWYEDVERLPKQLRWSPSNVEWVIPLGETTQQATVRTEFGKPWNRYDILYNINLDKSTESSRGYVVVLHDSSMTKYATDKSKTTRIPDKATTFASTEEAREAAEAHYAKLRPKIEARDLANRTPPLPASN